MAENPELQPATRADIHRLRNEVQRLVGDLATEVRSFERRLTVVETAIAEAAKDQLTPIQIGANMEKLNTLERLVGEVKEMGEGNKRRIWVATGAVGSLIFIAQAVATNWK